MPENRCANSTKLSMRVVLVTIVQSDVSESEWVLELCVGSMNILRMQGDD